MIEITTEQLRVAIGIAIGLLVMIGILYYHLGEKTSKDHGRK